MIPSFVKYDTRTRSKVEVSNWYHGSYMYIAHKGKVLGNIMRT